MNYISSACSGIHGYNLLIRIIRTSDRPSNAESQNDGLSSLIGSRASVVTDKPLLSANQLTPL
jgi:hypothetical protein